MPTDNAQSFDPKDYPSLDLAYDLAWKSHAMLFSRIDAAEGRLQRVEAFAATLTFAAPVLVRSLDPQASFASWWLYCALIAFAIILLLGVVSRFKANTHALSPAVMYNKWLGQSQPEFKKNAIYFLGRMFDHNRTVINTKGNLSR